MTEPWKQQQQQAQPQGPPAPQQQQEQQNLMQPENVMQRMEQNTLPDLPKINNNSNKVNGNGTTAAAAGAWQPSSQVHRRSSSGVGRPDDVTTTSSNKRYSLLDPDIFVPTAGSRLSSSRQASDRIRVPSPWRAGGSPAPANTFSTMTNAAPSAVVVPESGRGLVLERNEAKTLTPSCNPSPSAFSCPSSCFLFLCSPCSQQQLINNPVPNPCSLLQHACCFSC